MDEPLNALPPPQGTAYPHQMHLHDYLNILARRKKVVILFFFMVVGFVAVLTFRATPVYKATTQIIIERHATPLVSVGDPEPEDLREEDFYQTQLSLLKSRRLAYRVIRDLELWRELESRAQEDATQSPVRHPSSSGPAAYPSDKSSVHQSLPAQIKPGLVDWYLANLVIESIRGTRLVNISFMGTSKHNVARVANAHSMAFIEQNTQKQHERAGKALNWLEAQLDKQKIKVEASQKAIYEYQKRNNLIFHDNRQDMVPQKLMELGSALVKAKSERVIRQLKYQQFEPASMDVEQALSIPEVLQNSVIQELGSHLVQAKAKKQELSASFGSRHPKILQINSTISQLEKEIGQQVWKLKESVKAELDQAIELENYVQKELTAQEQLEISLNERAIQYDVLLRDSQMNQNIYDILLKQAKEIRLTSGIVKSNIAVVDEAEVPRFPVKPRILLNMFLAVVLGLIMGIGMAFFLDYMDTTVRVPEDILKRLDLPVLGTLPYDRSLKRTDVPLIGHTTAPERQKEIQQSYIACGGSSLYRCLQGIHSQNAGQVLMLESATTGEGKTTVLANFGLSLARAGLRVAMVDCDLQRPALHRLFAIQNIGGVAQGVHQVLAENVTAGTLDGYSVDDLFFLANLKRLTGRLRISNHTQTMHTSFAYGRLLHIQNENNPEVNRLGNILLRSGFLSGSQLNEVLEQNRLTGLPLGYLLINCSYITRDQLQHPLRLQMEEHLHKLFTWKEGSFVFEEGLVEMRRDQKVYFGEDYSSIVRHLGFLSGSCFVQNAIMSRLQATVEPNLYVANAGMDTSGLDGPLSISVLGKFIEILKMRFDVVLIDAPPVLDAPGARSLTSLADSVILVVKAGHLSVKRLREARTYLDGAKANIIGAVLNQVKSGRNHYS